MKTDITSILYGLSGACVACSVVSNSLNPMDCSPPGSFVHGIFSGKNTGVGCHFLLQGIFPTQGSNPYLLSALSPASTG